MDLIPKDINGAATSARNQTVRITNCTGQHTQGPPVSFGSTLFVTIELSLFSNQPLVVEKISN